MRRHPAAAGSQQVKIQGRDICQVCSLTVEQAAKFFQWLKLSREETDVAEKLLIEIRERLRFLNDVGLEYLTLDRLASTLSGGEAQRIQLATSLGSRLVGTLYVLDEPSIGLHSRDTHRLIKILHGSAATWATRSLWWNMIQTSCGRRTEFSISARARAKMAAV